MPSVLATPWLIANLEYAARDALATCLEEHERSVGTFVEVEHLAPAPEGFIVTCKARVIHVNGPVVTFQIEAHDGTEPIARGIHRRRVIDVDRFARRVQKKSQGRGGRRIALIDRPYGRCRTRPARSRVSRGQSAVQPQPGHRRPVRHPEFVVAKVNGHGLSIGELGLLDCVICGQPAM